MAQQTSKHHSDSSDNGVDRKSFLRPEPNSLKWKSLDQSQQTAFEQIARSLKEAVDGLKSNSGGRKKHTAFFEQQSFAAKRVLWLHGGRGMGKTTLLKSVAFAVADISHDTSYFSEEPDKSRRTSEEHPESASAKSSESIKSVIDTLQGRVVWLEPLELELLPGPTNLLAAILARVQDAVARMQAGNTGESHRGLLERRSPFDDAMTELSKLMTDVSLAWDGNAEDRAGQVDPDTYAREVVRAERARLEVPRKFAKVLDKLATEINWGRSAHNPLFVVSIDDCDLSPERCLEILRLIRLIESPRLFTIVLGDIDHAEQVVQMKFTGDRAKIAGIELTADIINHPFYEQQRHLTFEAMRKLVPPNQRIRLEPMTSAEILHYRPAGDLSSIEGILEPIEVNAPPAVFRKTDQQLRLLEFLAGSPFQAPQTNSASSEASATETVPIGGLTYGGLSRYRVPPRVVADLWFRLSAFRSTSNDDRDVAFKTVFQLFEDAVRSDDNLSSAEQRSVLSSFKPRNSDQPSWQITVDRIHVYWRDGIKRVVESRDAKSPNAPRVFVEYDGNWLLTPEFTTPKLNLEGRRASDGSASSGRSADGDPPALDDAASAMFCLTHDLIHLEQPGTQEPSCVEGLRFNNLARTTYDFGDPEPISIPWPHPQFTLFWEWDHFLTIWKQANRSQGHATSEKSHDETEINHLVYWWIQAALAIFDGGPIEHLNELTETTRMEAAPRWPELGARVEKLAKWINEEKQQGLILMKNPASPRARRWLEDLALILAPEMGLLPSVCQQFFFGPPPSKEQSRATFQTPELATFWAAPSVAKRIRRRRAQVAARFPDRAEGSFAAALFGIMSRPASPNLNADLDSSVVGSMEAATELLIQFVKLCTPIKAIFIQSHPPIASPGSAKERVRQAEERRLRAKERSEWLPRFEAVAVMKTPVEKPLSEDDFDAITKRLQNGNWHVRVAGKNRPELQRLLDAALAEFNAVKSNLGTSGIHPINNLVGAVLCPSQDDIDLALASLK